MNIGDYLPHAWNIGDHVYYVPHACFARHQNAQSPLYNDGGFAWVIGKVTKTRDKRSGEWTETVEELHGPELTQLLQRLKSSTDPGAWQQVRFIRPNAMWPAIVTGTWDDGTVDLDVNLGGSGGTLLQDRVKIDQQGNGPHTCHVPEGEPQYPHLLAHAYGQIQGRGAHRHHINGEIVPLKAAS
jgi:hypothetical protein